MKLIVKEANRILDNLSRNKGTIRLTPTLSRVLDQRHVRVFKIIDKVLGETEETIAQASRIIAKR